MTRRIISALLAGMLLSASCSSRWPEAAEEAFTRDCLEREAARGTSPLTARAYCECALDKTSKRYATPADAQGNTDSIGMAQDLEICRRSTR